MLSESEAKKTREDESKRGNAITLLSHGGGE